jgi:hypothetical protein
LHTQRDESLGAAAAIESLHTTESRRLDEAKRIERQAASRRRDVDAKARRLAAHVAAVHYVRAKEAQINEADEDAAADANDDVDGNGGGGGGGDEQRKARAAALEDRIGKLEGRIVAAGHGVPALTIGMMWLNELVAKRGKKVDSTAEVSSLCLVLGFFSARTWQGGGFNGRSKLFVSRFLRFFSSFLNDVAERSVLERRKQVQRPKCFFFFVVLHSLFFVSH